MSFLNLKLINCFYTKLQTYLFFRFVFYIKKQSWSNFIYNKFDKYISVKKLVKNKNIINILKS